jgi:FkbM family methyltransferase
MIRIARLLNEISSTLMREYLTVSEKVQLLSGYYWLRMRYVAKSPSHVSFAGLRFTTPSFSNFIAIVREVFLFGDYYFKAKNDAPLIIDCGANIGVTTLFLKRLYPNARVIAFEPSPVAVAALRKNISDNNIQNVTIVEAAVSNEEGTISFWEQPSKTGGSTAVRDVFESKSEATKFEEVSVRATRLSPHITEDIDLLKMDIEGAEGLVINELSMSGTLKRVKNIIMEFHENPDNRTNDLSTMITTLKENGFKIVIFASEITPSSEQMLRKPAHHFLLRASR